jgi:hypothetical protein
LKALPAEEAEQYRNLAGIDGSQVCAGDKEWRLSVKTIWLARTPDGSIPAMHNAQLVYEIVLTEQNGTAVQIDFRTFAAIVQSGNCKEYFLDRIRAWLVDPEDESSDDIIVGTPPEN